MNTQSNTQPKFDLYQEVTDKIIAALEQGTAPWLKPWDSVIPYGGMPCNAISGRLYSGINVLLLWLSAAEHGYIQRKWITAKAAIEAGGHVRKGEKATLAVSYRPYDREKTDDDGNLVLDDGGNPVIEHLASIKKHCLFNIEQCEKLPQDWYETVETPEQPTDENQYAIFEEIRLMLKGMDLQVMVKPSNQAYYRPRNDHIVMPEMKQFHSPQKFHSVLLHEMTHATGHQSRLARDGIVSGKARFGNKVYAFEELVAEMGCAFLCSHLGFADVPQNASYIESWIKVLREDKRAIFRASGKAREACQYMLDALNIAQLADKYEVFEEAA